MLETILKELDKLLKEKNDRNEYLEWQVKDLERQLVAEKLKNKAEGEK